MSTEDDWKKWGEIDPYFGVLSRADFKTSTMDCCSRGEFFETGETRIARLFETLHTHFCVSPPVARTLDFGCGVGRLLVPLARRSQRTLGVDVSEHMLEEARSNCSKNDLLSVQFSQSSLLKQQEKGAFDLIVSLLVFVHIPWKKGRHILRTLAQLARPGGVLAVQVLYGTTATPIIRRSVEFSYWIKPLHWLRNIRAGRNWSTPAMQLHVYPLQQLLEILRSENFKELIVELDNDAPPEFRSCTVIARKAG